MPVRLVGVAVLVLIFGVVASAPAYALRPAAGRLDRSGVDGSTAAGAQPAQPFAINLTGPEQVVTSWRDQACTPQDFPDVPARAFRDAGGQVQVIAASEPANERSIGPDFDHLTHSCQPIFTSPEAADPSAYNDYWWLGSFWTPDGSAVYALAHMEYHGHIHDPNCTQGYFGCWWNSITFAQSSDGGATYIAPAPPAQLVATFPYPYVPNHVAAVGYGKPSNIVFKDGYYYALLLMFSGQTGQYRDQQGGMCLIRTDNVADPASWRAWNGSDFSVQFMDPYTDTSASPTDHLCTPVSPAQLNPRMTASLTFNTYLNAWLLVDDSDGPDPANPGKRISGFYYSVSSDLIHWSQRQLFLSSSILNDYACGDADPVKYPSLIDPQSPDRNFATTGQTMELYYTRIHVTNCQMTWDRDLVRVPVQLAGGTAAAAQALAAPAWSPSSPLAAADAVGWCAPACMASDFAPSSATAAVELPGQRLHFNGHGACPAFNVPAGIVLQYSDGAKTTQAFGPATLPKVCTADLARR